MESISIESSATGLLLLKRNKKQFSLPWSHYAGAEYFPADPGKEGQALERIEIAFLHHSVTLHGRNLCKLMESIAAMHVARVPEAPKRYLETDSVRKGAAMVTRIDVEVR